MTSNNGLSLTNTRDVKANNIYFNYNSDIINILDLFAFKNETTNATEFTNYHNKYQLIEFKTFFIAK